MARLNDPPQPVGETLESLKRRFVRQNRELARVNSTQSIRIRSLESEVSRLLAENLQLKEQVINLQEDLDSRVESTSLRQVKSLKQKLEDKLADFGGLLQELDSLQQTRDGSRREKRKLDKASSPSQLARQKPMRAKLAFSDALAEGRLPPIDEERRSSRPFDQSTFPLFDSNNAGDSTNSPELGPPPIAHFDETEALKSKTPAKINDRYSAATSTKASTLLTESRRRRRESVQELANDAETSHGQALERTDNADTKPSISLKPGAKRKLHTRDEDDRHLLTQMNSSIKPKDRSTGPRSQPRTSGLATDPKTERRKTTTTDGKGRTITVERKALAPKHANTDLQSPIKRTSQKLKESDPEIRDVSRKLGLEISPAKHNSESVHKTKATEKSLERQILDNAMPPPKTPFLDELDLFSPTISDPSEPRPERGDTPPPPDLGVDTGTGSLGRTSRRARGSVSYAEPNLRDKMRRPTKELIDAVSKSSRTSQGPGDRSDGPISSLEAELEKLSIRPSEIDILHQRWPTKPVEESRSQQARQRAETSSPLGNKANTTTDTLPASVVTDRRRRASSISRRDMSEDEQKQSGSATAITALSDPSQRKGRNHTRPESSQDGNGTGIIPGQIERPSIFDFTSSSPESTNAMNKESTTARPMRTTRRHSSISSLNGQGRGALAAGRRNRDSTTQAANDDGEPVQAELGQSAGDLDQVAPEMSTIGRAAGRRRSMMI